MRAVLKWTLTVTMAAAVVYAPLLVHRGSATPDAYLNAVTATRTTLVQAILGFAVFIVAGVGYLNLRYSRRAQSLVVADVQPPHRPALGTRSVSGPAPDPLGALVRRPTGPWLQILRRLTGAEPA